MKVCYRCGKEMEISRIVGRRDACPACGADLRCCLNCTFHDDRVYNQCRESQAERVLEKDRSNFCDYFVYRNEDSEQGAGERRTARDNLASLFKK